MGSNSLETACFEDSSKTLIFIMKDVAENDIIEILILRHPHTCKSSIFLYNPEKKTLQEILTFKQKYRSWFIGDTVQSDGSLYLSTIIDPLFLILPYLFKATVCSPLDQIISDEEFPDTKKLLLTDRIKNISLIADEKDKTWNAWSYNEEKTLLWLKKKADSLIKVLKEKKIQVNTSCAISNTFIKPDIGIENDSNYIRYAHGMISEYLPLELCRIFQSYLGIPDEDLADEKKRKNREIREENIKKLKRECLENEISSKVFEDVPKADKKVTRKSAKENALAKAATGTKNISSFFTKK